MAKQGPSNTDKPSGIKRFFRSAKSWGVIGALIMIALVWLLVWLIKGHAAYPLHARTVDPSIVIGTFVTLYGLFIGGFGVLIGLIAKKSNKKGAKKSNKKERFLEASKAAAITLLTAGALFDTWRVWDASNDLYTAATHGFGQPALLDDVKDFKIYFVLNLAIVVIGILVATMLSGSADDDTEPEA